MLRSDCSISKGLSVKPSVAQSVQLMSTLSEYILGKCAIFDTKSAV